MDDGWKEVTLIMFEEKVEKVSLLLSVYRGDCRNHVIMLWLCSIRSDLGFILLGGRMCWLWLAEENGWMDTSSPCLYFLLLSLCFKVLSPCKNQIAQKCTSVSYVTSLPAADVSASRNCVTHQRLLSHLIYHKFDRLTFTENLCHYFRNSIRLYMICVVKVKHVESTL